MAMRFVSALPLLFVSMIACSQVASPTPSTAGESPCTDEFIAAQRIPQIATVNTSAKAVTFPGRGWGYEVDVATPSAWINVQRKAAIKMLAPYSGPSNGDRLAVLRVWVRPPAEAFTDEPRDRSVYNVVLRTEDHSAVVHPLCSVLLPMRYGNSGMTANGMYVAFDMRDFQDLLQKGNVAITFVLAGGKAYDDRLDAKKLAMLGLGGQN